MFARIGIFLVIASFLLAGCSDTISNGKEKVYYFFSPKCPHCENVKPYVNNASKKMEIEFCQVEKMSEECKEIAKKIGLRGVPTAVYKKGGELRVYEGEVQVRNLMLEILGGKG
jgi:thiol-disulfide isomerase/thioredoxin